MITEGMVEQVWRAAMAVTTEAKTADYCDAVDDIDFPALHAALVEARRVPEAQPPQPEADAVERAVEAEREAEITRLRDNLLTIDAELDRMKIPKHDDDGDMTFHIAHRVSLMSERMMRLDKLLLRIEKITERSRGIKKDNILAHTRFDGVCHLLDMQEIDEIARTTQPKEPP